MIDPALVFTRTLGILCVVSACASAPSAPGQERVAKGQWGGDHIGMEVTDAGAQLEFDCAHGSVTEAIVLDRSGAFEVKGTFAQERPGPRREDDSAARAVRYTGTVKGKSMSLTIRSEDGTSDVIATYTLEHGKTPAVRKCQ